MYYIITRKKQIKCTRNYRGDFKKGFYNHRKSSNNEASSNDTTFSKYIWEQKETSNLNPALVWTIAKSVLPYSNISKKCLLCLNEKLEIINYFDQKNYLRKNLNEYWSMGMLINFYCTIIKQSIGCNLLIGKQ